MANDRPDVITHPPFLYGGAEALAAALDWAWPLPLIADPPLRFLASAVLAAAGLVGLGAAAIAFHRAGTNVPTNRPATTVVEAGPYRYSRNPIYLSLSAIYLAVGVAIDTGWVLVLLVPLIAVLRYGVIAREEAYLERKFGAAYLGYKARVRRWL